MKEAHDPLEAELSALRPHEVSPELRRRVRIAWPIPSPQNAGTCGGSPSPAAWPPLAWWRPFSDGEAAGASSRSQSPSLPQPAPPVKVNAEDSRPMLLAYERAWPARRKTWMPYSTNTPWSPETQP